MADAAQANSIERFIEDQAFLQSNDLAPPPPPPLSPINKLDQWHMKAGKERQLSHRRGGGGGDESCDLKKVWSSINHSILFELKYCEIQFEGCKRESFALHSGCRKTWSDMCQRSGYIKIAMGKKIM
jgi:hypothetical protein